MALMVLAGCNDNVDSGFFRCAEVFGPPTPVDKTLQSFRVGDSDEFDESYLDNTLLRTFFQGIQPLPGHEKEAQAQELADTIGELSRPFINFSGDYTDYTSTRNVPDLMQALIASGRVPTFNNARNSMRRCVEDGDPGEYDNRHIRLTEALDDDAQEGVEPDSWNLRLRYNHFTAPNNNPDLANINRFISLSDFGITYQTQYEPMTYNATGVNVPREVRVFFNHDTTSLREDDEEVGEDEEQELTFLSVRPGVLDMDLEIWLWNSPDVPYTITWDEQDQAISCMIAVADYEKGEVEIVVWEKGCGLMDLPHLVDLDDDLDMEEDGSEGNGENDEEEPEPFLERLKYPMASGPGRP